MSTGQRYVERRLVGNRSTRNEARSYNGCSIVKNRRIEPMQRILCARLWPTRMRFDDVRNELCKKLRSMLHTHNGLSGCLSCTWSLVFSSRRARTGRKDRKGSEKTSSALPGGGTLVVIWNLNGHVSHQSPSDKIVSCSLTSLVEKYQNRLE